MAAVASPEVSGDSFWPIPAVTSTSSVRQLSGEKLPIKFSGEVGPGNIVSLTWARHFALSKHFVGVTDVSNAAAATPAPDGEPRSARELILHRFADTADAGPQCIAQLVEATGVDRNTIDQALHRMIAAEEVVRVDCGLYKLAPPKPTPPIVSSQTLIGTPPWSGMTSASCRWPGTWVSVRCTHSRDVRPKVLAV